jgi:hypothetical protein
MSSVASSMCTTLTLPSRPHSRAAGVDGRLPNTLAPSGRCFWRRFSCLVHPHANGYSRAGYSGGSRLQWSAVPSESYHFVQIKPHLNIGGMRYMPHLVRLFSVLLGQILPKRFETDRCSVPCAGYFCVRGVVGRGVLPVVRELGAARMPQLRGFTGNGNLLSFRVRTSILRNPAGDVGDHRTE